MTVAAFRESGLQELWTNHHITLGRMNTSPQSIFVLAACLAQVNQQRVYLPKGILPWPLLQRPARKMDHAQFRSKP